MYVYVISGFAPMSCFDIWNYWNKIWSREGEVSVSIASLIYHPMQYTTSRFCWVPTNNSTKSRLANTIIEWKHEANLDLIPLFVATEQNREVVYSAKTYMYCSMVVPRCATVCRGLAGCRLQYSMHGSKLDTTKTWYVKLALTVVTAFVCVNLITT